MEKIHIVENPVDILTKVLLRYKQEFCRRLVGLGVTRCTILDEQQTNYEFNLGEEGKNYSLLPLKLHLIDIKIILILIPNCM